MHRKKKYYFMEILVICFYVLFACSVIVAGREQDSAGKEDTGNKMNTKKERGAVFATCSSFCFISLLYSITFFPR